jgi:hypothetical protein
MTEAVSIPDLPNLPFPLPFGYEIDDSHILSLPSDQDFCAPCVRRFLDALQTQCVRRAGCDWVIVANRKVYYLKWRDIAPRAPWTRQVWDIFRLLPDNCGCPTTPLSLGWQWEWSEVIKTLRANIFCNWQKGSLSGSGQTVVAIGTNVTNSCSPGVRQINPVLVLDASISASITLTGGFVERWEDQSLMGNDATQPDAPNRPTVDAASLNGLDTIAFNDALEQFLNVQLKAQDNWHLFVVGRFQTSAANPRGTFFSAAGFESPYSGIDGKIYQDSSVQPEGTLFTYIDPSEIPFLNVTLTSGSFAVLEFFQNSDATQGDSRIGVNYFDASVFSGNTSTDGWDPTQQTFGEPIPIPAAVGRSNWGVNPARTLDYLRGNIAQVILYPEVLSEGQRVQIHNALRDKWGLGAPLPFPPSP